MNIHRLPLKPPATSRCGASHLLALFLLLLGTLTLVATAAHAATGLSVDDSLYTIDLETGDRVPGELLGLEGVMGLAVCPTGETFAVAPASSVANLYEIDRDAGTATLIGDTTLDVASGDLTCDMSGNLWFSTGGSLHSLDRSSATSTLIGGSGLQGIAARGATLYSLVGTGFGEDAELVTVDPETAAATTVALLSGDPLPGSVVALDFDARGNLWIMTVQLVPITPPPVLYSFLSIGDLLSGEVDSKSSFASDPGPSFMSFSSLAVVAGPFDRAIEIPALTEAGSVLLILLLAVAAISVVRRRSGIGTSP